MSRAASAVAHVDRGASTTADDLGDEILCWLARKRRLYIFEIANRAKEGEDVMASVSRVHRPFHDFELGG